MGLSNVWHEVDLCENKLSAHYSYASLLQVLMDTDSCNNMVDKVYTIKSRQLDYFSYKFRVCGSLNEIAGKWTRVNI